MDAIFQLGIELIKIFQSLGTWLLLPMQTITFLGNEEFFLFIAPAFFWCVDAGLGMRVGLGALFSSVINGAFKIGLRGPRPYWLDGGVKAYRIESSFGVPSNHAQTAAVVWGSIARFFNKRWLWGLCILLIAVIGFSRMYLGVHFPHDVLLGWLIGALMLWLIARYEQRFLGWFNRFQTPGQILMALGVSIGLILIVALIRSASQDWVMPQAWSQAAAQADPLGQNIDPMALSGVVSNSGAFFGFILGGVLLRDRGWFDARGALWKRALRFILGVLGVFILWFGLGEILPRGETVLPLLLRFLRYALVGAWVSGMAPLIFIRLKLANHAGAAHLQPVS